MAQAEWAGSQSCATTITPAFDFSEDEARERIQAYFDKFLLDYEVMQVLPATGRRHMIYEVKVSAPAVNFVPFT